MSEWDICERLDEDWQSGIDDLTVEAQRREAAATIRNLRVTLRRADELLAEGVGAAEYGDTADWRARVRAFMEERS